MLLFANRSPGFSPIERFFALNQDVFYATLKHVGDNGSLPSLARASAYFYHQIWQHGVTSLTFKQFASVTDWAVSEFVCRKPRLVRLNLQYLQLITDKAMESVAQLTQLTALRLEHCGGVTDKGLNVIRSMKNLEHLGLAGFEKMESKCITSILASLVKLNSLFIFRCGPRADIIANSLRNHLSLTKLILLSNESPLTDQGRKDLARLTNLRCLKTNSCDPNYGSTKVKHSHLYFPPNLEILSLSDFPWLANNMLSELTTVTNLKHLTLNGCGLIDGSGLIYIESLVHLRKLALLNCRFNDEALVFLGSLPKLELAKFSSSRNLSGEGLKYTVGPIKCLSFHLSGMEAEIIKGYQSLGGLVSLTSLHLSGATYGSLKEISSLINLTSLDVDAYSLESSPVLYLTTLTKLETLWLQSCILLDAIVLPALFSLPSLRNLYLPSSIPGSAIEKHEFNPELQVHTAGRTFRSKK